MSTQRVVFIASLPHSGSTLLDRLLGAHPRVVGLGSIAPVIAPNSEWLNRTDEIVCSCGQTMDNCVFWQRAAPELRRNSQADAATRLRLLLDLFGDLFGPDHILVDSSKKVSYLEPLLEVDGVDVRVVHLIKDVRAFTISAIDVTRRRRGRNAAEAGSRAGWPDALKFQPARVFWHWYRQNREVKASLAMSNLPRYQVGYEEVCLSTRSIVAEMCAFLELDYEPDMLDLGRSQSHAVSGNRMRHQPGKRQAIQYDNRWFHRSEWVLPFALFRNIARFNASQVYGNTAGRFWTE